MLVPFDQLRFARVWLDPAYGNDPAAAFAAFTADLLRSDHPGLERFRPNGGADGAIDLLAPQAGGHHVFECKCIGADQDRTDDGWAWGRAEAEWRDVEGRLDANLTGASPGRAQYAPWTDANNPVVAYTFAVTAWAANANQVTALERKITAFFHKLARRPGLAHLGAVTVRVLHWGPVVDRLKTLPGVAAHWFPSARPRRVEPLDAATPARGFARYLTDIPYLSPADHARAAGVPLPAAAAAAIPDSILDRLDSPEVDVVTIAGPGGEGKTRLMVEAGRCARARGWAVYTTLGNDLSETMAEDLVRLAALSSQPLLLLVDYAEQAPDFAGCVRQLAAGRAHGHGIRVVANARSNAYLRRLSGIDGQEVVELTDIAAAAGGFMAGFHRAVVDHILRWGGITPSQRHHEQCHGVPVLAVFMAHLNRKQGAEELRRLLDAQDFGAWLARRVEARFGRNEVAEALADLLTLLPADYLPQGGPYGDLQQWLLDDGWIYQDAGGRLRSIHDVVVDRLLLVHAGKSPVTARNVADRLLRVAEDAGGLASVLRSLQRVCDHAPYSGIDWSGLIAARCAKRPDYWRDARTAILGGSPLDLPQVVALFRNHDVLLDGAATERAFQRALGDAARAAIDGVPLDSDGREWLIAAMLAAAPHVGIDDYLITSGLRLDPHRFAEAARQWLRQHPLLVGTHFVLVAWLRAGLPVGEVAEAVLAWATRFCRDTHFSFLLPAYAKAGGDVAPLARAVGHWVSAFGRQPSAWYVYEAWLNAGGERGVVAAGIAAWLEDHRRLPEASHIYQPWLDASGEPAFVATAIADWLKDRRRLPEASHVYKSWLDASGDPDFVAAAIADWLESHYCLPKAQFVYSSWLDAGGKPASVATAIVDWLADHGRLPEARFVYSSWLEAGGEFDLIRNHLFVWLWLNGDRREARFVLKGVLRQPALPQNIVWAALTWCHTFADDVETPARLYASRSHAHAHGLEETALRAIEACWQAQAPCAVPDPAQVNGWLLLAGELAQGHPLECGRTRALLGAWLRTPAFSPGQPELVQGFPAWPGRVLLTRVVALVRAGELDLGADRAHLRRFLALWRSLPQEVDEIDECLASWLESRLA